MNAMNETNETGTKERPDSQCDVLMTYLLQEGQWLPQDKISICEQTELDFVKVVTIYSMILLSSLQCDVPCRTISAPP